MLALGRRRRVQSDVGDGPFSLLALARPEPFRVPARYSQLLNLALASLAAVACAAAHRRFGVVARVGTVAAILLLLAEFYVVKFPGGPPQPFPVPVVYRHVATLPRGAVLSLPDYATTPLWFREADYSYFSTVHWYPTVNGDSREWPAEYLEMRARVLAFPEPRAAAEMRDVKIECIVLHPGDRRGKCSSPPRRARISAARALRRRLPLQVLPADPSGQRRGQTIASLGR